MKKTKQTFHLKNMVRIGVMAVALLVFSNKTFAQKSKPWDAPAAAASDANPFPSNAQNIEEGKKLYAVKCNDCHGKKGKGDGPKSGDLDVAPKDFSKPDVQKQSDGVLFWKITQGRKPMPSFETELTPEQRWKVIDYVRTLK